MGWRILFYRYKERLTSFFLSSSILEKLKPSNNPFMDWESTKFFPSPLTFKMISFLQRPWVDHTELPLFQSTPNFWILIEPLLHLLPFPYCLRLNWSKPPKWTFTLNAHQNSSGVLLMGGECKGEGGGGGWGGGGTGLRGGGRRVGVCSGGVGGSWGWAWGHWGTTSGWVQGGVMLVVEGIHGHHQNYAGDSGGGAHLGVLWALGYKMSTSEALPIELEQ